MATVPTVVSTLLLLLILFYHLSPGSAQPAEDNEVEEANEFNVLPEPFVPPWNPFRDERLSARRMRWLPEEDIVNELFDLYRNMPDNIHNLDNPQLVLFIRVLFSRFRDRFHQTFGRFHGDNEFGMNNRFLVLLNDHRLLPFPTLAVGGNRRRSTNIPFTTLSGVWFLFVENQQRQRPQPQLPEVPAPPANDLQVEVPVRFRHLFGLVWPEEMMAYGQIMDAFINYVDNYPLDRNRWQRLFFDGPTGHHVLNRRRFLFVQALYGMIVMQPYNRVMEEWQQQRQAQQQIPVLPANDEQAPAPVQQDQVGEQRQGQRGGRGRGQGRGRGGLGNQGPVLPAPLAPLAAPPLPPDPAPLAPLAAPPLPPDPAPAAPGAVVIPWENANPANQVAARGLQPGQPFIYGLVVIHPFNQVLEEWQRQQQAQQQIPAPPAYDEQAPAPVQQDQGGGRGQGRRGGRGRGRGRGHGRGRGRGQGRGRGGLGNQGPILPAPLDPLVAPPPPPDPAPAAPGAGENANPVNQVSARAANPPNPPAAVVVEVHPEDSNSSSSDTEDDDDPTLQGRLRKRQRTDL